jgi:hypothetical protein
VGPPSPLVTPPRPDNAPTRSSHTQDKERGKEGTRVSTRSRWSHRCCVRAQPKSSQGSFLWLCTAFLPVASLQFVTKKESISINTQKHSHLQLFVGEVCLGAAPLALTPARPLAATSHTTGLLLCSVGGGEGGGGGFEEACTQKEGNSSQKRGNER